MQAEAVFPIIYSLSHEEQLKVFKMLEGIIDVPEKKPKAPKKMTPSELYRLECIKYLKTKLYPPKK